MKNKLIITVVAALIIIVCRSVSTVKQPKKQALKYSQEYVAGGKGIQGDVDLRKYIDVSKDFAIGANKYGIAVFKDPEKAFATLKELYKNGITLIQKEYGLEDLTIENCQFYKVYGAQIESGAPKEIEQARFVAGFLDIYENSFLEQ